MGAAAGWGAAVAILISIVGVVEVVFVDKLFAGGDVAKGDDKDAAFALFGFAIGGAGMVHEHGSAEAIDDGTALADAEEIGDVTVGVTLVSDGL